MLDKGRLTAWGTWLGAAALTVVPLVHVDGINRFVLLPQAAVLQVLAICGLLVWLRYDRQSFPAHPVASAALLFWLVVVLSALLSDRPTLSLLPLAVESGYLILFLFLLAYLVPASFETIARAAAVCAVIVSIVGISQAAGAFTFIPSSAQPSSTLGHRNLAAAYVISILPYVAVEAVRSKSWRDRLIGWGGVGLCVAFVIATRSRAAWIGGLTGASIVALAYFRGKMGPVRWSHGAGILVASLVVAVSLRVDVRPSSSGEAMWHEKTDLLDAARSVADEGGDKGRLQLWERTLEMIQNQPIIGVGLGQWRVAYPAVAKGHMIDSRAAPIRPHNDLLSIWAESGTVAAALILLVLFRGFRAGWAALPGHPVALAALCSVAAAVVTGGFGFSREFPATWLPVWVGLAILSIHGSQPQVRSYRYLPGALTFGVLFGILCFLFVLRGIRFDEHHLLAREAIVREDWSTVLNEADKALALGTFSEELFLLRGRANEAIGRFDVSLGDYETGLKWAPYEIGLWIGLGNRLRARGDAAGALDAFRTAEQIDPFDGRIHNNLGTLHAASGRLDSATIWLTKAIGSKSSTVDVYGNLSAVYRRTGDIDKALETARIGHAKDSTHVGVLNALGSASLASKDVEAALTAFRRALAIDSTVVEARFNLARVHEMMGSIDSAQSAYRKVLEHSRNSNDPRLRYVRRRIEAISP